MCCQQSLGPTSSQMGQAMAVFPQWKGDFHQFGEKRIPVVVSKNLYRHKVLQRNTALSLYRVRHCKAFSNCVHELLPSVSEIPDRRCSDISQNKIVRMKDDTGLISSVLLCLKALRHSNTGTWWASLSCYESESRNYSGHPLFFTLSRPGGGE